MTAEGIRDWADELASAPQDAAAAELRRRLDEEDALLLANVLKPYEDIVAPALQRLGARAGAVLDRLDTRYAKRAVFGNYTRIPDDQVAAILGAMQPQQAASLVSAMAVGLDAPREMARALAQLEGAALIGIIERVHPAVVIRLLRELDPHDQERIVATAGSAAIPVLDALVETGNRIQALWAGRLATALTGNDADRVRARYPSARALPSGPGAARAMRATRVLIEEAPPPEAAAALEHLHPMLAPAALRAAGAGRAAVLIEQLAAREAALAADLLEAMNDWVLLRPPDPEGDAVWWPQRAPAAAVLDAMDLDRPGARAVLAALRDETMELLLAHLSAGRRADVAERLRRAGQGDVALSVEVLGVGRGTRRSTLMDGGLRWIHIEEQLDTGDSVKPVLIDLLELPLERVRLQAAMAVEDHRALPASRLAEVFEGYRQEGRRPGEAFGRLGLVQLTQAVRASGALAAINGNFYFDYGHYINGVALGIDVASVPGLFFGDPIGWYVEEGRELVPASFNRTAGIATEDGEFHIEPVFMTAVEPVGGARITWDAINQPKRPGAIIAYTSLYGTRTEAADSHVDVAIARGRVWALDPGGNQRIPLTGLTLAIPRDRTDLLANMGPDTEVVVHHNFPPSRGRVLQAMACGPSLVRDGVLDIDFEAEDFGLQDSTVMSFFLPRWIETYQAARSFLAVRDRTLILGTVSGTAYGWGTPSASGGMTFGELAQLCLDLDVDRAYALDGGGSSSLVARKDGRARTLNSPTGGADVGPGEERYINTYWLVFPRN